VDVAKVGCNASDAVRRSAPMAGIAHGCLREPISDE
jgi:hypothetical protein